MDGMEIISIIGDLAKQAETKDGQVDFLCGNHDAEFIYFLCDALNDDYVGRAADLFTSQHSGIWELTQFDPDPNSELIQIDPSSDEFKENEKELWSKLYKKIPEILINMRNIPEGRMFLEKICQTKVAIVHDDTLFCHTDPTTRMITDLASGGNIIQRVSEINKVFQENLRGILFHDKKPSSDFGELREIYLNTGNRKYFVEQESFGDLVENLLAKLAEYLYKNKKIKFISDKEKYFDENGFGGHEWYDWRRNLIRDLEHLDFNGSELESKVDCLSRQ